MGGDIDRDSQRVEPFSIVGSEGDMGTSALALASTLPIYPPSIHPTETCAQLISYYRFTMNIKQVIK